MRLPLKSEILRTLCASTVQLNANLMTTHRLQVENTQVNLHTRADKDQGIRHSFSPTGQPAGVKL